MQLALKYTCNKCKKRHL